MPTRSFTAQTNLQLYEQLRGAGWSDAALARVRDGYELGMRIFRGRYRPSGKPLLSHLVGTASVLARHELPEDVVLAGLLHAAYTHGRFGDPRRGATRLKRRRVRRRIGDAAEALVAGYKELRWDGETLPALRRGLASRGQPERRVLAIRLANELEDHLDFGMHYGEVGLYHALYRGPALDHAVAIARGLGLGALAEEIEDTVKASHAARRPAVLRRGTSSAGRVSPTAAPDRAHST